MMLGSDLEVRRITAASLPQVVYSHRLIALEGKRLIDLLLFTVSGDSGQTVRGSHGSANAWPGVRSFSRCLRLHQTCGAVGAPLGAPAQPNILAF